MAPEWRAYPCWTITSDDAVRDNPPYSALSKDCGVSDSLLRELDEWDEEFQAIWDPNDPASAAFPSEEAENRWVERGKELARELAAELGPDVRVTYGHEKELIQPGESREQRNEN
ncbi:hypothetical protein OU415_03120 [Saccharopolyspora sp. WRP15-2]|uniref:Uncharacterized protein n=1 Tax=Saccharopolyspora oryzae TaxID=2997343 RepID=A0ABT4URR7_9PSEU|nr:hypothetical protein [Saccharopolyspora oryzae]MDA3624412.1 hypothetical protein [Saccharopolyspora oryzae]